MNKLDKVVAESKRNADARGHGYREQALKLYPWVCGKCEREFTRENLSELTVHHKDHNHDNNPADGSNWELLCIYCGRDPYDVLLILLNLSMQTHVHTSHKPKGTVLMLYHDNHFLNFYSCLECKPLLPLSINILPSYVFIHHK